MKVRIKFSKQGLMKFIGHLDIMRYFQKAMRRAEVDIRYSEGFSPHQIMSFAAPLGVGLTSNGEYVDIEVNSTGSSREMVDRLNAVMVEGMEILSYKSLPDDAENAMSLVAACDYTIRFRDGYESGLGLEQEEFFRALDSFLEEGNLEVLKKTKKGEKMVDLKPLIYAHHVTEASEDAEGKPSMFLMLSSGSAANIKPELVIQAFYNSRGTEVPQFAFQINREEVYALKDPEGQGPDNYRTLESYGEEIE